MSTSVEENLGFCWKCQALLNIQYPEDLVVTEIQETQREPNKKQIRILKTTDSLEATASNGCLLCLSLLYSLSIPERSLLRRITGVAEGTTLSPDIEYKEYIFLEEGRPPCISLDVNLNRHIPELESGNEIKTLLQLFPETETTPSANHGEIHSSTNSETSRSIVANWLEQCVTTHETCTLHVAKTTTLPTRVIDLGSGTPRLLVTQEDTPVLPYATLSHCWGSYPHFRLTSSNVSRLQKEIPIARLSLSFRDAFQVVQWLGLSYIWIDSICIIQDSAADWEKESALMENVYSNSYCNIAAAHAADGTYGCFVERDPRLVKPLKVNLNWGPRPGKYYAIQWLYWRQKVLETPLNTRAWVCQERYLAPRNLYFGETQLYWECYDCSASETFPSGLPPGVDRPQKSLYPIIDGGALRRAQCLSNAPELDSFSIWDRIVYTYSTGKLTYSEDKLVALSGLAARMQRFTQSQYLAGMWRSHFAYQLLWTVGGRQWVIRPARPNVYTAPTWSWASMHGAVENACVVRHADSHEIVLEIMDIKIHLVSGINPFGRVKGGLLRVRGHLAKRGVYIQESPDNRGSFRLLVYHKRIGTASIDNHNRDVAPTTHENFHYLPVRYNPGLEELNRNGQVMVVPGLKGLILQETNSDARNEFVRVGTFNATTAGSDFQAVCRQHCAEVRQDGTEVSMEHWGPPLEITII